MAIRATSNSLLSLSNQGILPLGADLGGALWCFYSQEQKRKGKVNMRNQGEKAKPPQLPCSEVTAFP